MDLLFLGTGAADWNNDDRGKDGYRRLSSMLINDDLLIDPGPNIFDFEKDFGFSGLYNSAKNILLTHSHDDHLNISSLMRLCEHSPRTIFIEENAKSALFNAPELAISTVPLYIPFKVGDYTVTALYANHCTPILEEKPLHFIIEKDNKRIFYGCDGAWFIQQTWWHMEKLDFDAIILDGTIGDGFGDCRIFGHNNLRMVELIAEVIRQGNMLKNGGKIIISHLSRDAHQSQSDVEKRLEKSDISVAYDGLKITL